MSKTYATSSWVDPRLYVRHSPIAGSGLFTRAALQKGEVIIRWGGEIFTTQQILDGITNKDTACQIDDDHYIASSPNRKKDIENFMNHSCNPNTWMDDEVTISVRRDILPEEEITADYALWVTKDEYELIKECRYGSSLCRHIITGDDWKLRDIQERYRGHVPPYLERRITRHNPYFN